MKKRTRKAVWLLVSLLMTLGFTSCGSTNQSVGENPAKQQNLGQRIVGRGDHSVYRMVKTHEGYAHPTFGKLTFVRGRTDLLENKKTGGYYDLKFSKKDGWYIYPRLTVIYGERYAGEVSPPAKKKTTVPAPKPKPVVRSSAVRAEKKLPPPYQKSGRAASAVKTSSTPGVEVSTANPPVVSAPPAPPSAAPRTRRSRIPVEIHGLR